MIQFDLVHIEFDSTTWWVAIANNARCNRALLGLMVLRYKAPARLIICLQLLYCNVEWDSMEGWSYE